MKSEAKKLHAKIKAMQEYLKSEEYKKLPSIEQNLCHQQLGSMQNYYNCLIKRIATAEEIDLFVMACAKHQEVDCIICKFNDITDTRRYIPIKDNGRL